MPDGSWWRNWFTKHHRDADRRYEPPDGSQTINEMLHVSALERWARPVAWDCPEDKPGKARAYRPTNLAAVVRAHHGGHRVPVVGHDGHVLTGDIPWPADS